MVEHNQSQYYGNQYKFNGKELDSTTGMYYYGARYYEPRFSIFVSVDPLAEKYPGISVYVYVANNPIRYTDPTGMEPEDWIFHFKNSLLTKFENTGKGSQIHIISDGKSRLFDSRIGFKNHEVINQRNQIINYIGNMVDNNLRYSYDEVMGNKGGHHSRGNVVVTNNAFKYNNYNDVVSVIEHESFHNKFGQTRRFRDHVDVYMAQAGTNAFKNTSDKFKASHAVSTGQRMLNAYIEGEYDGAMFTDKINEYNKMNPKNRISINHGGSDVSNTTLSVRNNEIKFDNNLRPNE